MCLLQTNFSFLSHFLLKLLNLCCTDEMSRGPLHRTSFCQEPRSFLKYHNNKHPTKDILNNGFTQKPRTMASKSKYLLSPSVAGTWEGGLCLLQSEEGNHGFWLRQCEHFNKKQNPCPTVYFISQFPQQFMKEAQKEWKTETILFFIRREDKESASGKAPIEASVGKRVSLYDM